MKNTEDAVKALRAEEVVTATRQSGIDPQTAMEVIRAYRRGVRTNALLTATGYSGTNALHYAIGAWALRHAVLPEDSEK